MDAIASFRRKPYKKETRHSTEDDAQLYSTTVSLLGQVSKNRADRDGTWIPVGRILYRLLRGSQTGLGLWDMWSKSSDRYIPGRCAQMWMRDEVKSAFLELSDAEAIKTLRSFAEEDEQDTKVKHAPAKAKPSDYAEAYHALGYRFTTNDMNDRVYVNGSLMTDGLKSLIMTQLREHGYEKSLVFEDAYVAEGEEHRFHPIKDYLNNLTWDRQDHIGKLASFVSDDDNVFGLLLRKWMIGAVSKVLHPTPTEQNPMLVLAGPQGLGKSVLVHWLGSPLPGYFIASAIYPDNKDFIINAASHFVWEVKELGSTIKRADVEALKGFLDTPFASFRPPYGRHEIKKHVTASFIGTINPDGNGFLNDPTGYRRYRICQLSKIDFQYYRTVDINQLWAQATALSNAGETYALTPRDESKVREINEGYIVDDPFTEYLLKYFDIDKSQRDWFTTTSEILMVLKGEGVIAGQLDRSIQMRLSPVVMKLGCFRVSLRIAGHQVRGWGGIRLKEQYQVLYRNSR